jgi:hypothetical protein
LRLTRAAVDFCDDVTTSRIRVFSFLCINCHSSVEWARNQRKCENQCETRNLQSSIFNHIRLDVTLMTNYDEKTEYRNK